MCDTMVAVGNSTADGSVILAKNSGLLNAQRGRLTVGAMAAHS